MRRTGIGGRGTGASAGPRAGNQLAGWMARTVRSNRYTATMQPVSVVATVLNEAEDIGRVVASLMGQDPPAAEVIVVDGGSSDGTWEWLAAEQAKGRDANDTRLVAVRDETCSLK